MLGSIKTVAAIVRVHRRDLIQGSSERKVCTSTYTLRECGFCWCDTTFNVLFFAKMVYIELNLIDFFLTKILTPSAMVLGEIELLRLTCNTFGDFIRCSIKYTKWDEF